MGQIENFCLHIELKSTEGEKSFCS